MKERERPTWFDFSVAAISPVLIMGLVGSLSFFLLDVLYGGEYAGRLKWTLFFFVVGAVLVARIAIVIDPGRAKLYGAALGGAVFLAMLKYLPSGPIAAAAWLINLVIIVVVLWSADRLVWNCTFLEERDLDPGRGLLADAFGAVEAEVPPTPNLPHKGGGKEEGNGGGSEEGESGGKGITSERTRRAPGISVIYFTLAAFPLFALGQSLIPLAEVERRRYAFVLMTVYVACGLGLLCTTTLLGLRRYLRQRRLAMPVSMTRLWLGSGGALIVLILVVGAFFPRPHAEYPLFAFDRVGSSEAAATRVGQGEEPGEGQGRGGAKGEATDAQSGSGRGRHGGEAEGKSGKPEGGKGPGERGSGSKSGREADKGGGDAGKGQNDSTTTDRSATLPKWFTEGLKWALIVMIGIPVGILVLVVLLRRMDSLPEWLRKWLDALVAWWQSLFGQPRVTEPEPEMADVVARPRPFRAFRNPFGDGSAAQRSADDLVRYTFAALEAWSEERELGRREDETPIEFAGRVGQDLPEMADAAGQLARHYANLAYGRRHAPEIARGQMEAVWLTMEAATPAI